MIDLAQSSIEPAIMIENRARAIDVKRCPKFFGDANEIDLLAMKPIILVMEGMHGASV